MPKQAKEYSERITFRVSPKLIEAIEAERAISGQSRTQLIREVLRSHFNIWLFREVAIPFSEELKKPKTPTTHRQPKASDPFFFSN
jgi:uncharacterized protein (DUF1778 family)